MSRILTFRQGVPDWQSVFSEVVRQGRNGEALRALAASWESADAFPAEVGKVLAASSEAQLAAITPMLAVPDFKVSLPGGRNAARNDIFLLCRSAAGPVAMMVAGRVDETFGPTLGEWRSDGAHGKERRLGFLLATLGISGRTKDSIRYALLTRAASAILTGEQYRAAAALFVVHSFGSKRAGWSDYEAFLRTFGALARPDEVQHLPTATSIPLFSAWITAP